MSNINNSALIGALVVVSGVTYLAYSKFSSPAQPVQPASSEATQSSEYPYAPRGGSRRRSKHNKKSRKYK
jgi:hypothetical protein